MGMNEPAGPAIANTARRWRTRSIAGIYILALILTAAGTGRLAAATGDYTQDQAAAGQQVFTQYCAKCHGAQLAGQAGPPLAGPKFAANLRYSKMSAQQMFTFIKTQMPADKPASLSTQQYLRALAYILSKNGYPAGSTPLSEKTLGQVKLLPYPGSNGAQHNSQASTQTHSR
jgi:mono/diheme cytochrome c family protein